MQSDMDKTKYIKANSVAFSGHRTIAEDRKDEIRKKLRGKIRLLYAMGITNFYCGMALGFDMLAAEEVISLKVELPNLKLIAVIPYDGQNERWSAREQDRYWDILDKADDAILLSKHYFNGCLLRRNDYMLSHSCGLIAFFDGKPKGGTFYPQLFIDIKKKLIFLYNPRKSITFEVSYNQCNTFSFHVQN